MGNSNSKSHVEQWSITLKPHRSLTRHGFLAVMGLVAVVNLSAGVLFLALGAWPVTGFMGLDMLIIWWAFRRNFADGERVERISAEGDALTLLRLAKAAVPVELTLLRRWVRVDLEYDEAREMVGRLFLRSRGEMHEIASFLGAEERLSLAKALRRAI